MSIEVTSNNEEVVLQYGRHGMFLHNYLKNILLVNLYSTLRYAWASEQLQFTATYFIYNYSYFKYQVN